jgi:hypothetical protein
VRVVPRKPPLGSDLPPSLAVARPQAERPRATTAEPASRPAPTVPVAPFRGNPLLAAGPSADERRGRRTARVLSLVAHAILVAIALVVPARIARERAEPEPVEIVF